MRLGFLENTKTGNDVPRPKPGVWVEMRHKSAQHADTYRDEMQLTMAQMQLARGYTPTQELSFQVRASSPKECNMKLSQM